MNEHPLMLLCAGACTSIGLSVAATLAAFEAGISRTVEIEEVAAVASQLELLPPEMDRASRCHWLACAALLDALEPLSEFRELRMPLLLATSDEHLTDDPATLHAALAGCEPRITLERPERYHFADGRSAWFSCMETAARLIADGQPLVAICAVDSGCDLSSLRALASRGELLDDRHPDGIIPGEGAAVTILTSEEGARRLRRTPWTRIRAAARGREQRHFRQDRSSLADGLTSVLRSLRKRQQGWRADAIYSPQPGVVYWSRELTMALLRNAALCPEPLNVVSLADGLGDCGAAGAALAVSLAALKIHRGELARVLAYGEANLGHVGACLLETP
ncbi:3-oxoacyl-[acyl-carrier-protein] synthase-1 [Nannocystis exedens]|uniref:3-oxoacyl-[acyl-carrier-protein] synthase-1 n=1 Tax=Nannocystis exedens TaxID=54 RepID=A0A1I1YLJ5_9BACT|nr:hypothetical protein [Nannocystis exedens]PCC70360.1 putative 3-oxoacyl-(acyl-carrier-protein) synthase [Nannocystis exedens]SFE19023.1 3-oxoacyl-[acyl-carrier-protein] synthase-1 [Nannocystis exedens]